MMSVEVSVGKSITTINDPLVRMPLEKVYEFIVHPPASHATNIERLRALSQIAPEQYRAAKKMLPYVVGATFNPMIRRMSNFAATSVFIVDIDHLSEKGIDIEVLKRRLIVDKRVRMYFLSPGGDGLKVFFHLKEKCDDKELYSLFYKSFVARFSKKYDLQQVVDARTSDVTRACFLSVDPDAYVNSEAEAIILGDYLPLESEVEMGNLIGSLHLVEVEKDDPVNEKQESQGYDPSVLDAIRKKLNPSSFPVRKQEIYTPDALNDVLPLLAEELNLNDLRLEVVRSIQYGKKLKVLAGPGIWAEINLFYGKHGFSVVQTTKTGSHNELAGIVAQMLREVLVNAGCYVR